MEFLAASQALTMAAITLPVLLAFYLLKLRRRPVRVSSILFWPRASEDAQANAPLRWLKPSWLLLLHLLALAGLLLAFARPVVRGAGLSGGRTILLIDASASMSARDEIDGKTRLDRAKARAKEIVRELRGAGGATFAVVSMSARPRPLGSFTASLALLDAAIDSVEATDQPADLAAALTVVDALSSGADDDDAPALAPTLFLLSDGSFSGGEGRATPASAARLRFERVGPQGEPAFNAGITRLAARRSPNDAGLVRAAGELVSNAREAFELPLSLALDGREVARFAVRLDRAVDEDGSRGRTDAPLRASFLESVRLPGAGVLTLTINRSDALLADNASSVVLRTPRSPAIAIVRAAATGTDPSPVSWMLDDVLAELRPRELARLTMQEWEDLVASGRASRFDLAVFDSVAPRRAPAIATLTLGALPPLPGWNFAPEPVVLRPNAISWDRSSPLLHGVSLDSLVVTRANALTRSTDELGTTREPAEIDALVRSDDTPIVFSYRAGGRAHACVAFALEDSNWPLTAGFAVFLANVVDELTLRERSEEGRSFATDEPVIVRAPADDGITLDGPVRVEVRARDDGASTADARTSASDEAHVGLVDRAGAYIVRAERFSEDSDRVVAVNLSDETESLMRSPREVNIDGRPIESFRPARPPREVWHWFVLAACGLLMIEWIVSARQLRA